jgi:L-asparagine transporter-like permease
MQKIRSLFKNTKYSITLSIIFTLFAFALEPFIGFYLSGILKIIFLLIILFNVFKLVNDHFVKTPNLEKKEHVKRRQKIEKKEGPWEFYLVTGILIFILANLFSNFYLKIFFYALGFIFGLLFFSEIYKKRQEKEN